MEEKLNKLYKECIEELKSIGIDIDIRTIEIQISKRNNKRYGCCKQEDPDKNTKYYEKIGNKRYLRYAKFNKHIIEISKWVMELNDDIIKNTIIHELIHCMPDCNNHGKEFKKYAGFTPADYRSRKNQLYREKYEQPNLEKHIQKKSEVK